MSQLQPSDEQRLIALIRRVIQFISTEFNLGATSTFEQVAQDARRAAALLRSSLASEHLTVDEIDDFAGLLQALATASAGTTAHAKGMAIDDLDKDLVLLLRVRRQVTESVQK